MFAEKSGVQQAKIRIARSVRKVARFRIVEASRMCSTRVFWERT